MYQSCLLRYVTLTTNRLLGLDFLRTENTFFACISMDALEGWSLTIGFQLLVLQEASMSLIARIHNFFGLH
jgi:hypothetical protein